ncbi:MAG TPA: bacillithiol biosynthesis cysteine-adding enzyme BshC [Candidatus Acidoferrales bacterium]|nr:bacillithiol biosynthesis cysteine-adding enzyme BshC [Candidatus Acidoferrales bacterium]
MPCIITSPMECHCLRFHEIPQTTKLFSSFIDDFPGVKEFYAHTPDEAGVRAAAQKIRLDAAVRKSIVEILREQNRALGSDGATEKNIDRLANGAAAVVTGQQVALFTGPAYSIYKALDAIHWAEKLTKSGIDAVPIFWMATEDHDLDEVNQVFFGAREEIARIELPLGDDVAGPSVGRISLGNMAGAVVEHALELLQGPGLPVIANALHSSYRDSETFGSAFGKLIARLMKGRGIILLDPLDFRLHELARPIFRKAVEDSQSLVNDLTARDKLLDKLGFHAQVKVTQQSTLLFLDVNGKRQPLRRRNGGFVAGDIKLSLRELLQKIDTAPHELTPSVLLRPVLQDSLLPTAAYIGGPAEVAYMAQAQVVYRRVLERMPAILPRASFTLIEPTVARAMTKYALDFRDALHGRQTVRRKMELNSLPRGLAAKFSRDEKGLQRILGSYRAPLGRMDKSLPAALDTVERKMLYQFEKLRGKAGRAENFRTGVLDRHEREILGALFPHHGLQERTLCLLPFLARHGTELLDLLLAGMNEPCTGHRVVML